MVTLGMRPNAVRCLARRLGFGACVALVLFAGSALADEVSGSGMPPPDATEADHTRLVVAPATAVRRWYGWQLILADAASTGLMIAGALDGGGATMADEHTGVALGTTSFVTFLLTGPLIHLAAHERFGTAAISLGLRAGGALVGAGVGAVTTAFGAGCQTHPNVTGEGPGGNSGVDGVGAVTACSENWILGAVAGVIVGAVIDDSVLAWERAPVRPAARASTFGWTPTFAPVKGGGATAGIAGTF
jgi:hypothetical protein